MEAAISSSRVELRKVFDTLLFERLLVLFVIAQAFVWWWSHQLSPDLVISNKTTVSLLLIPGILGLAVPEAGIVQRFRLSRAGIAKALKVFAVLLIWAVIWLAATSDSPWSNIVGILARLITSVLQLLGGTSTWFQPRKQRIDSGN